MITHDIGHVKETTWGEIAIGHIVQDKKGKLHTVVDSQRGWLLLEPAGGGECHGFNPVAMLDQPVKIYVPSDTEAKDLLQKELGARMIRLIEERERTLARALTWRMDPIPRKAVALRDHIDWFHGVNVDDVLRRWQGTKANPSDAARKKASLEELCRAHDEMHDDPNLWPHHKPHHHG